MLNVYINKRQAARVYASNFDMVNAQKAIEEADAIIANAGGGGPAPAPAQGGSDIQRAAEEELKRRGLK